jgi:cytochrome P450
MSRDILDFYRDVQREYGDVVYMRLGQHHEYAVFHPAQIHELPVMKARSFIRMEHPIAVIRQWNGDSVLVAEGDRWLRYRRLLQPPLLSSFSPATPTRWQQRPPWPSRASQMSVCPWTSSGP